MRQPRVLRSGGHPYGDGFEGPRKRAARRLDGLQVVFDDDRAVASAGLILPATLAGRLGLEGLIDEGVDLGGGPGAARPGRKVMTLVHAILAGADCIDDCRPAARRRGRRRCSGTG